MTADEHDESEAGDTPATTSTPGTPHPRDTDHPTGSADAAENAATESPS